MSTHNRYFEFRREIRKPSVFFSGIKEVPYLVLLTCIYLNTLFSKPSGLILNSVHFYILVLAIILIFDKVI